MTSSPFPSSSTPSSASATASIHVEHVGYLMLALLFVLTATYVPVGLRIALAGGALLFAAGCQRWFRPAGRLGWAARLVLWCVVLTCFITMTGGVPERWAVMAFAIVLLAVDEDASHGLTSVLVALTYAVAGWATGRATLDGLAGAALLILGGGWYAASQRTAIRGAAEAAGARSRRRTRASGVIDRAARLTSVESDPTLVAITGALDDLGFAIGGVSELRGEHLHDLRTVGVPSMEPVHISLGAQGIAVREDRVVVMEHYRTADARNPEAPPAIRSAISAPLHLDGQIAGVLNAASTTSDVVTDGDVLVVRALAAQCSRALENARRFRERRSLVTRMVELDEMKAEFLLSVTSDVRRPLTNVRGLASTLHDHLDRLPPEAREMLLGRLLTNAEELHELIVRLLDFNQLQTSAAFEPSGGVDLAEVVSEVVASLDPERRSRVRLTVKSPVGVSGDADLLRHVIAELVGNALQHSDGRVQLHVRGDVDVVDVEVSDLGPGLPPEVVARLQGEEGVVPLGLGLTMASQSLAVHDAQLQVRQGDGAVLGFRLQRVGRGATAGLVGFP